MGLHNSVPILLAAEQDYSVLAAVRALRVAGYAPWLAVSEPGTYAARSQSTAGTVAVPDPSSDREGFVRELAAASARLSVSAVLPSAEIHLRALAGREADFRGITLGVPPHETVKRATDKGMLPELAKTAGLQTPPTAEVVRGDRKTLGAFGFPAIVKPLHSRSATRESLRFARYVSNEREAEEAFRALPNDDVLVQPYIPGILTSISGVSWEGKLVCAIHQLSSRIWPVPAGVSSYAKTIPPNAELELGVGRLLQAIGWSGLFQAQFIRSLHGEHYLIDLNPRIYGSLALAISAGLNLPGIWVDLLLGRPTDVGGYRVGVRFRHVKKDTLALVRMLAMGELRRSLRGLIPRCDTTHAVFSLRDPMPLLTSAAKLIGRFRR